jgi:hypothetical protein
MPGPRGSTHHDPFAPAEGQASDPNHARFDHCRVDHAQRFDGERSVGIKVVGSIQLDRVNLAAR